MKSNMSSADRLVRLMIAVILAALYFGNVVIGTMGQTLVILAAVFTFTSLSRVCLLYLPFRYSTKKS
ncbi:DUF2892 domain-containing protein [bacterium SCSIO 12741]|nr:DUF2892 domain-containing protein [bacterium SCSIO 12741]